MSTFALAIHGGAGTLPRGTLSPAQEEQYHAALRRALAAGQQILERGGAAMDAATAAVVVLEDDPLFNAGRGAVFTAAGTHEMDAAVMDGAGRRAGCVASVSGVKNPIRLARAVMEQTPHVLLVGDGAMRFARSLTGPAALEFCEPAYFFTQERYDKWQAVRNNNGDKFGTVGAVARDAAGNVAAATSTGGMTNKMPGRVGDSPIVGAGVFADNKTCAVSSTGHGEFFIRALVAHDIACLMQYAALPLDAATDRVINQTLAAMGGDGGVVAVDKDGNISMRFNSEGMYRGSVSSTSPVFTAIY